MVLLLLLRLFQISSVFCVNVHLRLLRLSRSSHMGGATFFTNKVPMARFLCSIYSLVPSNFPLTRGTETKKSWAILEKTSNLNDKIEQNSNFAKWLFCISVNCHHSKIEVLHNCSAFFTCQFLWGEKIWEDWEEIQNTKTVPRTASNTTIPTIASPASTVMASTIVTFTTSMASAARMSSLHVICYRVLDIKRKGRNCKTLVFLAGNFRG